MNLQRLYGPPARAAWLKRAGAAGFVFFLVKGLLWLALPALLAALQVLD